MIVQRGGEAKCLNVPSEFSYSFAFGASEDCFRRVAPAEAKTVVPRSLVLATTKGNEAVRGWSCKSAKRSELQDKRNNVLNMTLFPSFHISVTIVSPG